jgi:phosphoglycolate phosphatase-like HAD superfamily hydrolase
MSKLSGVLHQKLFDMLYDLQILPQDTLFVSRSEADLVWADKIGLKTAQFLTDKRQKQNFIPHISFGNYYILSEMLKANR